MKSQDRDSRDREPKPSDREFVLFGEFADLDESHWKELSEEDWGVEEEQRPCEGLRADEAPEPSQEVSGQLRNVVEVQFKGSRRSFFENEQNLDVVKGDPVFVEAEKGVDLGIVHLTGELVHVKRRAKGILYRREKRVLRKATSGEKAVLEQLRVREKEALEKCRERILHHGLLMRLVDVEYQFDGKRVTFYYTANRRVDFRSLVKDLASIFRTRIEMRQIGMREESKAWGGVGICGRDICCASWIPGPRRITLWCAKVQNLSANPARLTGRCGRLKCCLAYEAACYAEALKEFPTIRSIIHTKRGSARVEKVNIFDRTVSVQYLETDYRESLTLEEVNRRLRSPSLQNG